VEVTREFCRIEAVKHGIPFVFRMDETTSRAWLQPRVRTIPCLTVHIDEMTTSAYKRARQQVIQHHLRLRRELLQLRRDGHARLSCRSSRRTQRWPSRRGCRSSRRTRRWCQIPCRWALLYALAVISSMRTAKHGIVPTRGCGHALPAVSSTWNTDSAPCFTASTRQNSRVTSTHGQDARQEARA